ncbi:MAG: hypothetical protein ACTSR8_03150 [Promethearchaeota archaeon]
MLKHVRARSRQLYAVFLLLFCLSIISWMIFESNTSTYQEEEYISSKSTVRKDLTVRANEFDETFDNYSKIPRRRIFFDISHEQLFSPWDTGFYGYSNLTMLLKDYFLEVSTITTSLNHYIKNMTSEDILFLNVAKHGNYTMQEINNITNFVDKGGKLIILGEHGAGMGFKEFQNPLLNYFDMNITNKDIEDPQNNTGWINWNIFNSTYFNLTNLSLMGGAGLDVYGDAFPIGNTSIYANYPNQPILGGYNNSKGGKVFCATDAEWVWNGNKTYCGINYGNNSKLVLKVLDWFYDTNLSEEISAGFKVIPEYELYTCSFHNNFTLNMTITRNFNVSASIEGGNIFPFFGTNLIGKTQWKINVTKDGYVIFRFTKPSLNINFTKIIYFFEGNGKEKVLFIHHDYSRTIDPSPSGLLKLALALKLKNYSIFAAKKDVAYSHFNSIFIVNPLDNFNSSIITELKQTNKVRILFLNAPYCTLKIDDYFFGTVFRESFNSTVKTVPINTISTYFGVNFSRHLLADDKQNKSILYYPKIIGANNTFYNLSVYMPSIINSSTEYTRELIGYNSSWGDDISIFGVSTNIGEHKADINNTCVMAYTNESLASGILSYYINEYFNPNHFFNDFLYNWLITGKFNKKIKIKSNVSEFHFTDTHYKVVSIEDIKDPQGLKVNNGTVFNVILSKGQIISEDAVPGIPGFQIKAFNASINVIFTTSSDLGLCELSIYNSTKVHVIMSLFLNFSDDGDSVNPNISINLPIYGITFLAICKKNFSRIIHLNI